jgi:ABC-type phosphate transport system substrate-binding protein
MNTKSRTINTLLLMLASQAACADIAIIGNVETSVGELDTNHVKSIFLGEQHSFTNGIYAYPINQMEGSPDRTAFLATILKMSEAAHEQYWQSRQDARTGYRPVKVQTYDQLLDSIRSTPGAITYIDSAMVDDTVKVLMTFQPIDVDRDKAYANTSRGITLPK